MGEAKRRKGLDRPQILSNRARAQVAYFCPACQSIEVEITRPTILDPAKSNGGATFRCGLCGTTGDAVDLIGAVNTEQGREFWDAERVGRVMMRAGAKIAAAPMLQVLELIGLVPRIEGTEEEQASAQALREAIVRETIGSFVEAAFLSAAKHSVPHFEKFGGGEAATALLKDGAGGTHE